MNIKKLTMLLLLAVLPAAVSRAQIKVDAPNVVDASEQFNVTFTLTDKPSDFDWTPGDGFQLVWGPQTGSSTSISIINGKTTRNSQYTYTYVLLPKGTGEFSLPPAHAVVSGNDIYSRSLKIEVVGEQNQPRSGQPAASSQQDERTSADTQETVIPDGDLFMRLSLSRTSVVVGEPVTAVLKLYTRGGISGFEDAKFPTFNGFWSQEVEAPQSIEFQRENVGGRIYNTALLRKWVIIPQKSGSITIEPANLVCLVQQRISSGNSIFDGFFDDYRTIRKRVVTRGFTVNVSPLPSGAPASFTGAVGKYRISARLSTDSLKVHDAASLVVTVTGSGNVALVGAPKIKFPPDSELYDTKISEKMDRGSMSGSKTFEYPFIPRSYGDFEIEPVEFSYFDISTRKYVTIRTQALPYNVAKGLESNYVPGEGVSVPSVSHSDVRSLGEDIHYISTRKPDFRSGGSFFVGSVSFIILAVVLVLSGVLAYVLVRRLRRSRSDVAMVRTKAASKVARKRLAMAGGYLAKNLHSAFYEELHKALLGYASDKLNIGSADLSKDVISGALISHGAPESLTGEFVALLDECEFARYAPDSGNAAMKESYDKAMAVISSLDANMKKTTSRAGASAVAILLLCGASLLQARAEEPADSLWNAAVEAYAAADYPAAVQNFCAIEQTGVVDGTLYTNIGNAYFKEGSISQAILYYERALKLDPSSRDARYNLDIAAAMIQDRIEPVPEFFMKTSCRRLCYSLPSDAWAWMCLAFLLLTVLAVLLLLLSRSRGARMTGFFGAIVALLLSIICLVNASWQKSDFERRNGAIVTVPVCPAGSAPSSSSGSDLFVLHEGTKVTVHDTVGDYVKVSIADGREGWVRSRNITVI